MSWKDRVKFGHKLVTVTAKEVKANIKALNLYPFGFLSGRENGHPHPHFAINPRPVLLVHGVVHNASAFIPLRRRMRGEGWKNIYSINYSTRHGSFTRMVEDLAVRVEKIVSQTGSPQIDIVAHSLGGLVSRYYMSIGEGRGRVKNLVTLGTPHQGTPLSIFLRPGFLGGLSTDLRSGSYTIKLLNETSLPRESRLTSIYSPYDFVAWGENCRVEGLPQAAFQNVKLPDLGHLGLLYDERAFSSVMSVLTASQVPLSRVD